MRVYDLYDNLLKCSKGTLGGADNKGLIVYGRVGEPLEKFPEMITNSHQRQFEAEGNNYKAYMLDIFALQLADGNPDTLFAAEGRIVVLCDSSHPANTCTALKCKLFYNRNTNYKGREANLVIGCFYEYITNNNFKILPAKVATANQMAIGSNRQTFIDKFILPNKMQVVFPDVYPRKLGNECPLTANLDADMPVFYRLNDNKQLIFQSAFTSLYNAIQYKDLCEEKAEWNVMPELDKALNYTAFKQRASCPVLRTPNELSFILTDAVEASKKIIQNNIENYLANPHTEYASSVLVYANKLKNLLSLPEKYGKTNKSRLKAMLRALVNNSETGIADADAELATIFQDLDVSEIIDTLFMQNLIPESNILAELLIDLGYGENTYCYALIGFFWATLNIRANFNHIIAEAKSPFAFLFKLINQPYTLAYTFPELSITELDLLACFTGNANSQATLALRNVAYMHTLLCTHNSKSIIFRTQFLNIQTGYILNPTQYANYTTSNSLLTSEQLSLSHKVLGDRDNSLLSPVAEPFKTAEGWVIPLGYDADAVVYHYINSGLGIEVKINGNKYLMDYTHALMYTYVLNRLYTSAQTVDTDITDFDFDSCRNHFEMACGFKLEKEQARVAELLKYNASCIVGSAGTGKTTTIKYLIYLLKTVYNLTDTEICLVAPTGMAARRMTQCTEKKAHTIHSKFMLDSEEFKWGKLKLKQDKENVTKVIIVDESSMIALPLLYNMLLRVAPDTKLFFVGDTEQLPPINVGKPLSDMLTYLPYVRLQLSKRTVEGSKIACNCDALITDVVTPITEGADCKLYTIEDNVDFADVISAMCKIHLGKQKPAAGISFISDKEGNPKIYEPDDIQVVTPVAKAKYNFSSYQLNNKLRWVFNPKVKGQKTIAFTDNSGNEVELREGDRVLNTLNIYDAKRYFMHPDKPNCLILSEEKGIGNGEIGIIKKIALSDSFEFMKYEEDELIADLAAYKSAVSNANAQKLYILVEFTDCDNSKFYVKYVGYSDSGLHSSVTQIVPSFELRALGLAYALTVHKMQGNQAKLIIAPFYAIGRGGFINRNMLYTAWSRALDGLYIVGDVEQTGNTALNKARSIVSTTSRLSPSDLNV